MQITHITLQIGDQTLTLTLAEIQELLQLLLDIPGVNAPALSAPSYTLTTGTPVIPGLSFANSLGDYG